MTNQPPDKPPKSIYEIMKEFDRELRRMERAQFLEMGQRWVQVERALEYNITLLVNEIDARRLANKPVNRSALQNLERYRALLQQAVTEANRYEIYAARVISSRQTLYGEMAIAAAQATIRNAVGPARSFNQINIAAVQNMVGICADGSPLFSLLKERSIIPKVVDGITEAFVTSTALGYNPRQTARQIKDSIAGGLDKALTIARTEQIRVYREAGRAQYLESGVVKTYTRHCAFSERTCLSCVALDGKVYTTDEIMDNHPNCRCFSTPNVDGYTPSHREGAQDWLAKQDEDTQRSVLGNHYDLYKNGMPLTDMVSIVSDPVWGPTVGIRPLSELGLDRE